MPDAYHRLHIYHLNIRIKDMCYAQAGDHVKVNSGQHEGQTGMVVRVEDPVCVLVSDATHEELQVFARDLTESSEAATGLDRSVRHLFGRAQRAQVGSCFQITHSSQQRPKSCRRA